MTFLPGRSLKRGYLSKSKVNRMWSLRSLPSVWITTAASPLTFVYFPVVDRVRKWLPHAQPQLMEVARRNVHFRLGDRRPADVRQFEREWRSQRRLLASNHPDERCAIGRRRR